jgi:CheY-like chemotaxis protein
MASIFLSSVPRTEPVKPSTKKLILVVDDIDSTREFVGYFLQHAGYDVVFAKEGRSAVESALTHRPDLIVLDVIMPGLDGYTVCRQLKSQPSMRSKIILFSALNSLADRAKAEEAGCDSFLEKPVEPSKLLSLIQTLLA